MKPRPLVLIGIFTPLALGGVVLFFFFFPGFLPHDDPSGPHDHLEVPELALMEPGDIVLHRGTGLAADLITLTLQEKASFTHGAFVLEKTGSLTTMAHSLSSSLGPFDGVQTADVAYFQTRSAPGSLVVVRPLYRPGQREAALRRVRHYLENRTPFNAVYDLKDTTHLYCTQFLAQVLVDVGFWPTDHVFSLVGPVLAFSNFLDPGRFRIIVSHNPAVHS